jgi:hypothetical protein
MTLSPEERERLAPFLESSTYRNEVNGCWLSKLSTYSGYSQLSFRGKHVGFHRLSYAFYKEGFDDNLDVLHKCDVRRCFNPEHLFLGTQADNAADMVAKGRSSKGEKHYMFGNGHLQTGEKNGHAKLQKDQIIEILTKRKEGLAPRKLAKEYGVSLGTIEDIIYYRKWKHIQRSSLSRKPRVPSPASQNR